jgi:HEAT repeat protein
MLALMGVVVTLATLWPGGGEEIPAGLASRDDAQRVRAALELTRAAPARATALLVPLLGDRDAGVRLTAARLLARRGPQASAAATAAALAWLGDAAPRERLLGLLVLREVPELPDDARRAVERALRNGDVTLRLQGLEVVAAHPSPSSFGAVVALLDDEIGEVRARALRAIAALGDRRASLAVARRLSDPDRGVRMEAAATLGALGDGRVVPALVRQLDESATDPRAFAVDALGALADPAALPALARLARRAPRDDLARRATLALGAIATPAAVEVLLGLAREPPGSDDVRVALERVGGRALPRLCHEVETGPPTAARLAADVLGRLGDRRATGALVGVLDRGRGPRVAALEALARLADPAAIPALVRVAIDGEAPELRALALDALAATADARARVALPRALGDAAATVRARAARLAGLVGGAAELPALAAHLGDGDALVRGEAARALARLPVTPAAAPELVPRVVQALAPSGLAGPSRDALAALLERVARGADVPALGRAYLAAPGRDARAVLARGLAAAGVEAPLTDAALVDALVADLAGGGAPALAAAEALSVARLPRASGTALLATFARAEDGLRARLCPAVAGVADGVEALTGLVSDAREAPSVRAAAAWALAGASSARDALLAAAATAEPAVAANARAALAIKSGPARGRWTAVALVDAAGDGCPGRWIAVAAGDAAPVWALTDEDGRARLVGIGDGELTVRRPAEPGLPAGLE